MNRPLNGLHLKWALIVITASVLGWAHGAAAKEPDAPAIDLEGVKILDLHTAARIALAGNPSLAAARARVEQARQAVLQARSTYYPRLDFDSTASRVYLSDSALQDQRRLTPFTGDSVDNPEDFYAASLTASWVLFDGFERKFNLASARHGEQISAAANDDVRRLLLQSVISAFLSAQFALENIAIAKADEDFNQRQLTEAKLRYDVGTGALSDVLNFEVRANSAISDRILAERVYQTSRIALAALLGIPDARIPDHTELSRLRPVAAAVLEAPDLEQLLATAHAQRPDLQQGQWAVKFAEADVEAKRATYYPTLTLLASYVGERTDDLGFGIDNFGNTVAINLTYNLFAGGLFKAQHQEAKARLYETEKSQEAVEINVTSEVRSVAERVLSAQQQLLLQRTNADLVQRTRDLVEKEYKAGVGSLVRLNEAQRDLTNAQVNLSAARTALLQAGYDLQSSTGQILTTFDP